MAAVATGAWPVIDWLEGLEIGFLVILPFVALLATLGVAVAVALAERHRPLPNQTLLLTGLVAVGVVVSMALSGIVAGWFAEGFLDVLAFVILCVALVAVALPLTIVEFFVMRAFLRESPAAVAAPPEFPF